MLDLLTVLSLPLIIVLPHFIKLSHFVFTFYQCICVNVSFTVLCYILNNIISKPLSSFNQTYSILGQIFSLEVKILADTCVT